MNSDVLLPGEFEGDGLARTANGSPYDPLAGIPDPEDAFWLSSKPLEEIRRYARSQGIRVNPWALLDAVLARLSVAIPPHVVIDPLDSLQPSPLNVYVALLGGSGAGKGITERAAQTLVPDIRQALTHVPASGEGIPTMFAAREKDEDGSSYLKPTAMRALLSVPEISHLGSTSQRIGSTLVSTLLSVYSGEQVGASNRNEMDRFEIPRNGYRLSLITGVQPANANVLFDRTDSGLPQRFLWADVRDPETPLEAEKSPEVQASLTCFPYNTSQLPPDPKINVLQAYYNPSKDGLHQADEYPHSYLTVSFPACTVNDFDRSRILTNKGVSANPLDAHRLMVTARVAALLALLERPKAYPSVTELDWANAKTVLERSAVYRSQCLDEMKQARSRQKADEIEIVDTARSEVTARGIETTKGKVMDYLNDVQPGRNGIKGYSIAQHIVRTYRTYVYPALEELHAEGHLRICGHDTGKASRNSWRPA